MGDGEWVTDRKEGEWVTGEWVTDRNSGIVIKNSRQILAVRMFATCAVQKYIWIFPPDTPHLKTHSVDPWGNPIAET
jgi:hypothetical protein